MRQLRLLTALLLAQFSSISADPAIIRNDQGF